MSELASEFPSAASIKLIEPREHETVVDKSYSTHSIIVAGPNQRSVYGTGFREAEGKIMAARSPEETRQLSDLKPHSFAQKVFGEPPSHEVTELAADLKVNGQHDAIDILPDGSIINGWTRYLAAQIGGPNELRVIVHDLDETAARRFILEANLLRHHYGKLTIARIYVELKKLVRGRSKKPHRARATCGDRLAKRFCISGRTLDKLETMLGAPAEVQHVPRWRFVGSGHTGRGEATGGSQKETGGGAIPATGQGGDHQGVPCQEQAKAHEHYGYQGGRQGG